MTPSQAWRCAGSRTAGRRSGHRHRSDCSRRPTDRSSGRGCSPQPPRSCWRPEISTRPVGAPRSWPTSARRSAFRRPRRRPRTRPPRSLSRRVSCPSARRRPRGLPAVERDQAPYEAAAPASCSRGRCARSVTRSRPRAELATARRTLVELGAAPAVRNIDQLPARSYPAGLSERELQVLRLVAEGRSNPDIARDAGAQPQDRGAAPEQHLRQARRVVPDRGGRVRARARTDRIRGRTERPAQVARDRLGIRAEGLAEALDQLSLFPLDPAVHEDYRHRPGDRHPGRPRDQGGSEMDHRPAEIHRVPGPRVRTAPDERGRTLERVGAAGPDSRDVDQQRRRRPAEGPIGLVQLGSRAELSRSSASPTSRPTTCCSGSGSRLQKLVMPATERGSPRARPASGHPGRSARRRGPGRCGPARRSGWCPGTRPAARRARRRSRR